MIYTSLNDRVI